MSHRLIERTMEAVVCEWMHRAPGHPSRSVRNAICFLLFLRGHCNWVSLGELHAIIMMNQKMYWQGGGTSLACLLRTQKERKYGARRRLRLLADIFLRLMRWRGQSTIRADLLITPHGTYTATTRNMKMICNLHNLNRIVNSKMSRSHKRCIYNTSIPK